MEDILKECESVIDEVCEKYGYEMQDAEGNDSLRTVLKKMIPCMLEGKDKDSRELLYTMLRNTPIIIVDQITPEKLEEINKEYIGDINQHIEEEEQENPGEYGKNTQSVFTAEPVINENIEVIGKKSYVVVNKVQREEQKKLFRTDINVSHLAHELDHAWNAQQSAYTKNQDGTIERRMGAFRVVTSYEQIDGNKVQEKTLARTGLYIEEAMATINQEKVLARYLGLTREELEEKYKSILSSSTYQGSMRDMIKKLLDKTNGEALEKWRLTGDTAELQKEEDLLAKTEYWKRSEEVFMKSDTFQMSFAKKREIFAQAPRQSIKDFFAKHDNIFFPDVTTMTPIERIDNILAQSHTFQGIQYQFDIINNAEEMRIYQEIVRAILQEGYLLINQAEKVKNQLQEKSRLDEIKASVEDVTSRRVLSATSETKSGVKVFESTKEIEEQGDNSRDE